MNNLGEFELLVLAGVADCGDGAYMGGVARRAMVIVGPEWNISSSAVHTTIVRLQCKGLLRSGYAGAKRIYQLTDEGWSNSLANISKLTRIGQVLADRNEQRNHEPSIQDGAKPYPIRIFYNGIRGTFGRLQKCWYVRGAAGMIRVTGVWGERFSEEIWAAFSIDSDPETYRFDPKNQIEVYPTHRLYADVERACKKQEARPEVIRRVRLSRKPSMRGPKVTARSLGHVRPREQKPPRYPQIPGAASPATASPNGS